MFFSRTSASKLEGSIEAMHDYSTEGQDWHHNLEAPYFAVLVFMHPASDWPFWMQMFNSRLILKKVFITMNIYLVILTVDINYVDRFVS